MNRRSKFVRAACAAALVIASLHVPPARAVSEAETSFGKLLVTVADARDLMLPRLSPNGRWLAYAVAIETPGGTQTEIRVLDIRTSKTVRLLSGSQSSRYAKRATTLQLRWSDDRHLTALIGDGDQLSAELVFNVATQSRTRETRGSAMTLPVAIKLRCDAARALLIRRGLIAHEASSIAGDCRNDGAWTYLAANATSSSQRTLFEIDAKQTTAHDLGAISDRFLDAFHAGSDVIVVEAKADGIGIRAVPPAPELTLSLPITSPANDADVDVEHRGNGTVTFLVRNHARMTDGTNALYSCDGKALAALDVIEGFDDISIAADRSRAAIAYWKEGRRRISVYGKKR